MATINWATPPVWPVLPLACLSLYSCCQTLYFYCDLASLTTKHAYKKWVSAGRRVLSFSASCREPAWCGSSAWILSKSECSQSANVVWSSCCSFSPVLILSILVWSYSIVFCRCFFGLAVVASLSPAVRCGLVVGSLVLPLLLQSWFPAILCSLSIVLPIILANWWLLSLLRQSVEPGASILITAEVNCNCKV